MCRRYPAAPRERDSNCVIGSFQAIGPVRELTLLGKYKVRARNVYYYRSRHEKLTVNFTIVREENGLIAYMAGGPEL